MAETSKFCFKCHIGHDREAFDPIDLSHLLSVSECHWMVRQGGYTEVPYSLSLTLQVSIIASQCRKRALLHSDIQYLSGSFYAQMICQLHKKHRSSSQMWCYCAIVLAFSEMAPRTTSQYWCCTSRYAPSALLVSPELCLQSRICTNLWSLLGLRYLEHVRVVQVPRIEARFPLQNLSIGWIVAEIRICFPSWRCYP